MEKIDETKEVDDIKVKCNEAKDMILITKKLKDMTVDEKKKYQREKAK